MSDSGATVAGTAAIRYAVPIPSTCQHEGGRLDGVPRGEVTL